jgi:3-hydroxy-3-methylglutaryl CoA synthase
MVQKSFFHLLFKDIEENKNNGTYPKHIIDELKENQFKNDPKALMILVKHFGQDWKHKCERSLLLAKKLGNIYTGSLYNGLLSLLCDESIDL